MKTLKIYCLIFIFFGSYISAQEVDIIPQLKKIEAGNIEEVKGELSQLKIDHPGNPNVIFLEAVITEDGERAHKFYEAVYTNFPKSQFADASLFRNYSYFFALGLYKKAEDLRQQLLKNYPNSPYLNNTSKNFPNIDEMLIVDSNPYPIKPSNEVRFTIQAGAFGKYENAESLNKTFEEAGLESQIIPKRVNNIQLHIVTVGNFNNRRDAEDFLKLVNGNYSLNGRIIKVD